LNLISTPCLLTPKKCSWSLPFPHFGETCYPKCKGRNGSHSGERCGKPSTYPSLKHGLGQKKGRGQCCCTIPECLWVPWGTIIIRMPAWARGFVVPPQCRPTVQRQKTGNKHCFHGGGFHGFHGGGGGGQTIQKIRLLMPSSLGTGPFFPCVGETHTPARGSAVIRSQVSPGALGLFILPPTCPRHPSSHTGLTTSMNKACPVCPRAADLQCAWMSL